MSVIERNPTREVQIGNFEIGAEHPIAVQSMAATHTQDIEATVDQINLLEEAGAAPIRIAVDSKKDIEALPEIRKRTGAYLSADLQESWQLAEFIAPFVDKIRYNPGHLYHLGKGMTVRQKVAFITEHANKNNCALRIGVNCGSVDPEVVSRFDASDTVSPIVTSALEHSQILESLGFYNFCVSLKDSDPIKVIEANRRFAQERPDIPLHLGVTEAGLPPKGVNKSRFALGTLLSEGIGDTLRISLTVPYDLKGMEVEAGRQLIEDVYKGAELPVLESGLNIISCPSCSRVENEAFVDLAQWVEEETQFAREHDISIAVMGCRVNGPGETDNADLGAWCGPTHVNLKKGHALIGQFTYDEIRPLILEEVERLIEAK